MQTRDMTSGPPARLILQFALPLMLGNVFQQFYTFVDTMVVGQALGVGALAALGAFMVSFSNTQHLTSAQDVQGSRAYWAAKGGVQWAAGVIAATNACPAIQPAFADGFNVVVGCQRFEYVEGVATRAIYWLQSTATTGGPVGSASYIERQVQAFVE